jgi:hypothetical protein
MAVKRPIYLDFNATNPTDPAVAIAPILRERFDNPK